MSSLPIEFAGLSPAGVVKYSPPESLVNGNPRQVVQTFYESAEHSFRSGIWQGEIGAYRLDYPVGKHEFFYITEGRVRVTPDEGGASEYGPNDACLLPPGFKGVFEILEAAKKYFVVVG